MRDRGERREVHEIGPDGGCPGPARASYNPRVPSAPSLARVVLPAPALPDPLAALRAVADRPHPFLRLAEGPGFRGEPWSFLGVAPTRVLTTRQVAGDRPLTRRLAPLRAERVRHAGPRVPFGGGWAGMLGYEARTAVERTPPSRRPPLGFPTLWLGRYEAVAAWNHRRGTSFLCGLGADPAQAEAAARDLGRLLGRARGRGPQAGPGGVRPPRPRLDATAFQAAIHAAREAVLRGDIFQANVSQRFDAAVEVPPHVLFEHLVASQPAPYMTYLDVGDGRVVLSASPERFLRLRGRTLETDPMKGTRPRGATRAEDRRLRDELEASAKDQAELAMIVDLSRNDLARVCAAGSVRVTVPRRLLRFARVHQAIAVVRGRLARGHDRLDALQAAFPPGSVTGAPKVRAMEIIDELEGEGRGPYCGALGWFDAAGGMDLSVAIRTILVAGRRASYRVGGGITLGSDPHDEWRETLDKGRGLYAALCGREDRS